MTTSLLVALYTTETILRIPPSHHMALQFRNGALPLLEALSQRQKQGKLELTLLTNQSEFFGTKLFAPITKKYPNFKLLTDATGPAGEIVLDRHWRERALELNAHHSLRIMVVGTRKSVTKLWRPDETVVVEPFIALTKDERKMLKADGRLPNYNDDYSMDNLLHLVDDAISAPEAPLYDVLTTSSFVKATQFPLIGNSFGLSTSKY